MSGSPFPTTLRARLTLWYTVLLAVPLIVFALVSYVVVTRTLERRTDIFIGDALNAFSREVVAERRAMMSVVAAMQTAVAEVKFRDLNIAILDTTGRVVAINSTAPPVPNDVRAEQRPPAAVEAQLLDVVRQRGLGEAHALTIGASGHAFRMLARPFTVDGQRFMLTGAYSLRDIDDVLERLRRLFLLAIPGLLIVSALGGHALARRSLAPVAAMSAQAAAISASNMHERLPVGGGAELVGLASVFNGLLDRLQASFDQQRRFVTDASHELRTPTAVVRTEADVTLSRAHRSETEYRESVAVIQDAARRLTRIVDDLFLLSRADAGHLVMHRAPLDLEELVQEATRAVRSVAGERGVDVEVRDVVEAPLLGDADLLGRLLLNLLDNAIKHSPRGGTVDVTMARRNGDCEIRVGDNGPGIPEASWEQVFDRFHRLDSARARSETSATTGAGLGLAIARRIAEMHAGRVIIATSRPGRTEFLVTMPIARSAS
ncbi:MAG TPA: ATP-binding protein [Gemmatimonadaceae bacterium]|nr:ATP-binding protein [Gemmatimonadaceae bacterium]